MSHACLVSMSLVLATCAGVGCAEVEPVTITNGQGEIAGEVTTGSVILQSRLTTGSTLVDGDLPGTPGVGQFEVASSSSFTEPIRSAWLAATPERDGCVRQVVQKGLHG